MSPGKNNGREYYGKLFVKDINQICHSCPMLWFYHDDAGGWTRLETKLILNNLEFRGSKIVDDKASIPDVMQDLANSSILDGAKGAIPLKKCMAFRNVIQMLEEKGLITASKGKPSSRPNPSDTETALSVAHRSEVHQYVARAELESITENTGDYDLLGNLVTATLNDVSINSEQADPAQDIHIIIEPEQFHPDQADPNTSQPSLEIIDTASPDQLALALLTKQHETALARIKQLESSNKSYQTKLLQFENLVATDRGALLSEMKTLVTTTMSKGFKKFELGIAPKLGSEMRSELSRQTDTIKKVNSIQTDTIMKEVAVLGTVKCLLETCHTTINVVNESLTEISELNNRSSREMTDKLHLSFKRTTETLDKVCSNTTSLKESLLTPKENPNKSFSTPWSKTHPDHSLTPASSPPPPRYREHPPRSSRAENCTDCGSVAHSRHICPKTKTSDFCPRCLSDDHKVYNCPEIRHLCPVCRDNGLGDLAYGHTRNIHLEKNSTRREYIMRFISTTCFSDWTNSRKRKSNHF